MKPILSTFFGAAALVGVAFAQPSTTIDALTNSAVSDTRAAIEALEKGDYAAAATRLELASKTASRLNIQNVSGKVLAAAPKISAKEIKYALAGSSTLSFDAFRAANSAGETVIEDEKGRIVKIRIFSDPQALDSFTKVAADEAKLNEMALELVSMRGEQAIKKRGDDGELSVLMMSEADHALIEIEGDSEDAVMALIEELEK